MKTENIDYEELIKPYKEEALKTLIELLEIPSVLNESNKTAEKPFGLQVDRALEYVATLGEKLGFKVDRCDGYVTELTYGEGKNTFDIYAHVDVVPVKEENWSGDPFKVRIIDGNIIARGSSDDKGPGLACLFALKTLIDNKMIKGHKIRFLFGGNEESGSLCLDHYFNKMNKEFPTFGISPDADYPVIYGEKSIYAYSATYDVKIPNVQPFSSGDALNIVLAQASCMIEDDKVEEQLKKYLSLHSDVKASYDGKTLTFVGRPCHGSTPWFGVSGGLHLLNFLGELYSISTLKEVYKDYVDGKGESFDGNFKDEDFSETSYNVGKIEYKDGKLTIYVNLRFTPRLTPDAVLNNLRTKRNARFELISGGKGFITDKDSKEIQILVNAYREESKDMITKPLAIGGGTYARESKNSVAFGAQFPNRDYRMHGDDEFFPIDDFYMNMKIYAHALADISKYLQDKE